MSIGLSKYNNNMMITVWIIVLCDLREFIYTNRYVHASMPHAWATLTPRSMTHAVLHALDTSG